MPNSEVGHTCVDLGGRRCRCGLRGCWETIASARWLRAEARDRGITGARTITPGQLSRRAESGDTAAHDLLETYADHVAVGIANLIQVLPLRLFVLHGDVVGGGELLLAEIREAVQRRTLPIFVDEARVEFADADQDFGLLGAAATALMRSLEIEV